MLYLCLSPILLYVPKQILSFTFMFCSSRKFPFNPKLGIDNPALCLGEDPGLSLHNCHSAIDELHSSNHDADFCAQIGDAS